MKSLTKNASLLLTLVLLLVSAPFPHRSSASTAPPEYDLIITDGLIVDGTGRPLFSGDVAVSGDRIAFIGKFRRTPRAGDYRA